MAVRDQVVCLMKLFSDNVEVFDRKTTWSRTAICSQKKQNKCFTSQKGQNKVKKEQKTCSVWGMLFCPFV